MGLFSSVMKFVSPVTDALTGAKQTEQAINAQTAASNKSDATLRYMYDQQRKDQQPWMDAGKKNLGQLQGELPNSLKSFTMADFQKDPGYDFRMQEGQKALERSAAARGGLNSGGAMKALARYGQDFASNEYSNAYNRFNNDRDARFNKLSGLSGMGQQVSSQMANTAGQYGQALSQNQLGLGNAQAAAYIGQANRMSQLIGQGAGAGAMYMASDERVKTNIEKINQEDMAELKACLKPYKFNYAHSDFGHGDWIGVMAQDLEKSKLGKTLVTERNGVKHIEMKKLLSLFLATLAEG